MPNHGQWDRGRTVHLRRKAANCPQWLRPIASMSTGEAEAYYGIIAIYGAFLEVSGRPQPRRHAHQQAMTLLTTLPPAWQSQL
jgi:hypothetical protein